MLRAALRVCRNLACSFGELPEKDPRTHVDRRRKGPDMTSYVPTTTRFGGRQAGNGPDPNTRRQPGPRIGAGGLRFVAVRARPAGLRG